MRNIQTEQRGDTIIEVLIAVVVVGLAIGLAYGTASRSLKLNQQAQERGEALKLVEGQVERLKSLASKPATAGAVFAESTPFCIVGGDNKIEDSVTTVPPLQSDPLTGYNSCVGGVDNRYRLSIKPNDGGTGADNQFSISARWDGLSGKKEEVNVKYRLHPPPQQP